MKKLLSIFFIMFGIMSVTGCNAKDNKITIAEVTHSGVNLNPNT